jgi:hypothetical protein
VGIIRKFTFVQGIGDKCFLKILDIGRSPCDSGLSAVTDKIWNGNCGNNTDYGNHDHQLNQGKSLTGLIVFMTDFKDGSFDIEF